MKLTVNKIYSFRFAGQIMKGKMLSEDELRCGTKVYRFEYNKCIYPVREENIVRTKKK